MGLSLSTWAIPIASAFAQAAGHASQKTGKVRHGFPGLWDTIRGQDLRRPALVLRYAQAKPERQCPEQAERAGKMDSILSFQNIEKPRAPRDLYSAPITGSSRPPGAFTLSGASWDDMTAPDPAGSSRWTRRATLQVSPSSAPQH